MKNKSKILQYYVEGEDEKMIEVLKTDMRLIMPGKVQILNVVQERISDTKLRILSPGTILVFVFDTDVGDPSILIENVFKYKRCLLCFACEKLRRRVSQGNRGKRH